VHTVIGIRQQHSSGHGVCSYESKQEGNCARHHQT
jgi:hypothetical protein